MLLLLRRRKVYAEAAAPDHRLSMEQRGIGGGESLHHSQRVGVGLLWPPNRPPTLKLNFKALRGIDQRTAKKEPEKKNKKTRTFAKV